jgi:glyoxylase-like metal-dependent hydrolase (beta-lactamase superfamily II)
VEVLITEIAPKIYVNRIPLPNFPIHALNSYIITSDSRALIIDTGFNTDVGREAVRAGIADLNINLNKTDVILTHMHPDHTGMANHLQGYGARIFIGKKDGSLINRVYSQNYKTPLEKLYETLSLEEDIMPTRSNDYGENTTEGVEFHYLTENSRINIGDFSFEVLDIPGHTPGHIGLYEKKYKLFFCGDHILENISPSVLFWGFEKNILGSYLNSLQKVYRLEIDYLFTAHHDIINDHQRRITQLFNTCTAHLEEIKEILKKGKGTPWEIASLVHWYEHADWNHFSKPHKFVAIGETLALLEHLTHQGHVTRHRQKTDLYYRINDVDKL